MCEKRAVALRADSDTAAECHTRERHCVIENTAAAPAAKRRHSTRRKHSGVRAGALSKGEGLALFAYPWKFECTHVPSRDAPKRSEPGLRLVARREAVVAHASFSARAIVHKDQGSSVHDCDDEKEPTLATNFHDFFTLLRYHGWAPHPTKKAV